jgi:hypothetical protein
LIRAEAADLVAATQPEPQEWIVLTSWRQVEPSTAKTGRVADYDTGAEQENSSTNQAANRAANPAANLAGNQVTVTRLILRVYPADAITNAGSATASGKPAAKTAGAGPHSISTPKPILDLPAVPFGDGWLVIQL